MTGYDLLAMRYIRRPLPWIKVGFAAFVSYAFSNTIGLSVLTSGSVRYRLYSRWGLTAVEITKVVIFTALTLWLGILTVGGSILAFMSIPLPLQLPLSFINTHSLGLLMLIIPTSYLLLGILRRQPFRLWRWELPMVRPRLALPQLIVGILDWAMAGSVFYILLPPSEAIGYFYFLGIFLIAQTAGLISHVPGGLGIFESLIVLLLSPYLAVTEVLGALLAYRLIYYLLPLGLATLGLGIHESCRVAQRP
jgi:phosphatidylglycerol lysyltransferase